MLFNSALKTTYLPNAIYKHTYICKSTMIKLLNYDTGGASKQHSHNTKSIGNFITGVAFSDRKCLLVIVTMAIGRD